MKRRRFLKESALAYGAFTVSPFLKPLHMDRVPDKEGRVVVMIHLSGGNDGLNTVVPYTNEIYYRKRPTLAIPGGQVIRLNHSYGFNPAIKSLMPLYEKGQMQVLNGVGYEEVHPSHYTAARLWKEAGSNAITKDAKPESDAFFNRSIPNRTAPARSEENMGLCDEHDFQNRLLLICSRIEAGSQTSLYHIALDGFDTHQFQRLKQDRLLAAYAAGIATFFKKLSGSGLLERTLIGTYSEFGRSTAENTKRGTEHGRANALFLFGSGLTNAGMDAGQPDLEAGALPHQTHFRSVYAALAKWRNGSDGLTISNAYPERNGL